MTSPSTLSSYYCPAFSTNAISSVWNIPPYDACGNGIRLSLKQSSPQTDIPATGSSVVRSVERLEEHHKGGMWLTIFTFPSQPCSLVACYQLPSDITSSVSFSHVFLSLGGKSALLLADFIFVPIWCPVSFTEGNLTYACRSALCHIYTALHLSPCNL